jgi:hypothetical protein
VGDSAGTGIGFASAAGGFVGLFVGVGLGHLFAGPAGQRTSGGNVLVLALAAAGVVGGAYAGGYLGTQHVGLPALAPTTTTSTTTTTASSGT